MEHIFLIPGFFGFSTIGEMRYFFHVHRALGTALVRQGAAVRLYDVPTLPTASLHRRAARLAEVIAAADIQPGDRIHLVGHSTGGLDARLLLSPGGGIPLPANAAAAQICSVVSVASPHHGAPVAGFFATVQGERWLRLLSILTLHVVRRGSFATLPTRALVGALARTGSLAGVEEGLIKQVWQDVLRDFNPERQEALRAFFREVWKDRSLLGQLTPPGLARLSGSLTPRPGVRYGSVVLRARPPSLTDALLLDAHPSRWLYTLLHPLAGWSGPPPPPRLSRAQAEHLRGALGVVPTEGDSDAIVPTLSQLHGDLIAAAAADHLDVLGYFRDPEQGSVHVDWLQSGSNFSRAAFKATWTAVGAWLLGG